MRRFEKCGNFTCNLRLQENTTNLGIDAAYITYTSGSTGLPKGVVSVQKSCTAYIQSMAHYMHLTPGLDCCSVASSQAWDTSVHETYTALASGCPAVMLSHDEVRSGNLLLDLLAEEGVTCAFLVPSLLRTLQTDTLAKLPWPIVRMIFCGGEALPQDLADTWAQDRALLNIYGAVNLNSNRTVSHC